jgi:hypothetical protein
MKDTLITKHTRRPLFSLGQVIVTPGALAAFAVANEWISRYLAQHQCGEWGHLDPAAIRTNETALRCGGQLSSAYELTNGTRFSIVTEADRSTTTVLLPEE